MELNDVSNWKKMFNISLNICIKNKIIWKILLSLWKKTRYFSVWNNISCQRKMKVCKPFIKGPIATLKKEDVSW